MSPDYSFYLLHSTDGKVEQPGQVGIHNYCVRKALVTRLLVLELRTMDFSYSFQFAVEISFCKFANLNQFRVGQVAVNVSEKS